MSRTASPLSIWLYLDGKAGHDRQSRGLVKALGEIVDVHLETIRLSEQWWRRLAWAASINRAERYPKPQLVVGAGHRTHLPLLLEKHRSGARAVVLMKPTLPLSCFDLCIIPHHDALSERSGVVHTLGVLNDLSASNDSPRNTNLILLGGPSKHYRWVASSMARQIIDITSRDPRLRWIISNSRRTPEGTLERFESLPNVTLVDHRGTEPSWLEQTLAACTYVWVSEDSVSMIYEALSAGAATGLLSVQPIRQNRLTTGVNQLVSTGLVTTFDGWKSGVQLKRTAEPFNEARRVATWMVNQWL